MRALLAAVGVCLLVCTNLAAQDNPSQASGDTATKEAKSDAVASPPSPAATVMRSQPPTNDPAPNSSSLTANAGRPSVSAIGGLVPHALTTTVVPLGGADASSWWEIDDSNSKGLFRVSGDGKVGIGTTSPVVSLDVNPSSGTAYIQAKGTYAGLVLNHTTTNAQSAINFRENGTEQFILGTSVYNPDSTNFDIGTAVASLFRIQANGNVGIGAGTASLLFKLDVKTGASEHLAVGSAHDGFGFAAPLLDAVDDSNNLLPMVYNASKHVFYNGSVGIGTWAPSAALDVLGNQAIFRQSGGGGNMQLGDRSGNSTGYFTFANSSSATNWRITSNNNLPGGLEFMPSTAAGGNTYTTSAVAITNAGSVGIGTPTPNARLSLGGGPAGIKQLLYDDPGISPNYKMGFGVNLANPNVSSSIDVLMGLGTGTDNSFNVVKPTSAWPYSTYTKLLTVAENGDMHTKGNITADGSISASFQDVAEWVPVSEQMTPGTVVVVSDGTKNTVAPSNSAYDTRVAGVVSAAPGLLLGVEGSSKAKIATTGRVRVRVDANLGAIHLGDLLVTSDTPGTAMKSDPLDLGGVKIHRPGTLIGKALEPLDKGQGEILVLLSLQ